MTQTPTDILLLKCYMYGIIFSNLRVNTLMTLNHASLTCKRKNQALRSTNAYQLQTKTLFVTWDNIC